MHEGQSLSPGRDAPYARRFPALSLIYPHTNPTCAVVKVPGIRVSPEKRDEDLPRWFFQMDWLTGKSRSLRMHGA